MNGATALLLVFVVLRGVLWALDQRTEAAPRAAAAAPPAQPFRPAGPARDASFGVALAVVAALVAFGVVALATGAGLLALPLFALAALAAEPWLLARLVAIPLGWPRVAYWLTRASTVQWYADRAGGARFAAAWAATRRTPRDEPVEAWVESLAPEQPITAATMAAHGLLAASRGDRHEARELFRASDSFDTRPRPMVRAVTEWLAAEAATRGDWEEVERLATDGAASLRSSGDPPTTRPTQVLGAVAARLLDRPDAPDATTFADRWRSAPSLHAEGAELYHRAMHARHRPPAPPEPRSGEPLHAALEAHRAGRVGEACERWALAIAHHEPPAAFRAQVVEDLADLAERGRLRFATLHAGLGPDVVDVLRERHLRRIEAAVKALRQRVDERRWLEPMAEAREWVAIKTLYEDAVAVGGDGLGRLVYHPMLAVLADLAAELYNHRRQPYLFRAMTLWLLDHGARVGDERACELLAKNLNVSKGWS